MNTEPTIEIGADLREKSQTLGARLRADRLARRLSWEKYAKLLDVPLSTLGKITRGVSKRPHETTLAHLERKLADLQEPTTT
jgi:transcriptional regulator with XRE-family HTH domain